MSLDRFTGGAAGHAASGGRGCCRGCLSGQGDGSQTDWRITCSLSTRPTEVSRNPPWTHVSAAWRTAFMHWQSTLSLVMTFFVTWPNKLSDRCVKFYNELNHLKQGQQIDQSHPKEGVFFTGLLDKQLIVNEYQFLNAETLHRWADNEAISSVFFYKHVLIHFVSFCVNCVFNKPDKISWSCWTLWTKRSPSLESLTPYWTSIHWYVGIPFVLTIQASHRVSNWLCCIQFTEAKVYHNKLVNIRKEMITIHEKTTKLKVSQSF